MNIILIKDYKIGAKVKKAGSIMGVTVGLGETLIEKGIAEKHNGVPSLYSKFTRKETPKKSTKKDKKNVILQNNNTSEDTSDKTE